jgi:hypothetical protein
MTIRVGALTLVSCLDAALLWAAPEPLPADPPIEGVLWSVVVPAILLAVAVVATALLYRHFAGRDR